MAVGQHARFIVWLPVLLAAGIALYFALPWEPGGTWAFGMGMLVVASVTGRLLWGRACPCAWGVAWWGRVLRGCWWHGGRRIACHPFPICPAGPCICPGA
ncbi:hypothetical protein RAA17_22830 [Komagataeibacter rhaeticus]|nr:hypothetical protein [Komagataeibacter rhaeticus]